MSSDKSEWTLLDTDLTTQLAILPAGSARIYFENNEPGAGELKIPLASVAAGLVTSGMFVTCNYRGSARGGFFVDNLNQYQASTEEGAGQWLQLTGRGPLALLEDAIIWDDGTPNTSRDFTGTQASILITLLTEAQARGGLTSLTWDFTAVVDTNSVSWTDTQTLSLTVGQSLLDLVRQFARSGTDFGIEYSAGSFVFSAYKNGRGSDKAETQYFRVGTNCQEVQSNERGDQIENALLVAYQSGSIVLTDSTSISNRRRRESLLDAKNAQTSSSASTYGSAILAGRKDPRKSISVKVYDGVAPLLFDDYILGDYITLDVQGTETRYRILGIQAEFQDDDYANVIIELNSIFYENSLEMQQQLDQLTTDWQTAHDAGLLEVSYWAAIGDASITYNSKSFCIIGDYLYLLNSGTGALKYGLKTGIWTTIIFSTIANCMVAVGTNLYIGASLVVHKYDTLTDTITTFALTQPGDPLSRAVWAMAVNGTTLYASGAFETINAVAAVNIAQCDTTTDTWSAMADEASFVSGGTLSRMLYSNGLLYSAGGTQVQAWNGTTWSNIGTAFTGNVLALAEYGTDLLIGAPDTDGIFIWDGLTIEVFGGGVNGAVRTIGVYLTDVYIGGSFTDAGNYVSRYSGGTWWQLESGVNALVDNLILKGQDLYVAGDFTTAGGKPAQGIAAYFNNFESLANYLENSSSSFNLGAAIHAATASAITDTDEIPFWEATANALRKITWANIKATLKTYFDTLYVSIAGTSTTQVLFNDAGGVGGDAGLTYNKTNNMVEVGGTNWYSGVSTDSVHTASETGGASTHVVLGHSYQNGTGNFTGVPSLGGDRAGGSKATPTAVLDDMGLVRIIGGGYDGVGLSGTRAQMVLRSAGNWAAGDHPTSIEFWTTPIGSITRALSLTVKSTGNVNIPTGKTYDINDVPHTHSAADIAMPKVGTPTLDTLSEDFTTRGSSGVSDGTLTYVAVGSTAVKISVAAGEGYIRTSNDQQAPLVFCKWATSTDLYTFSAPAAGQENTIFIGIEYNAGTPQAVAKAAFTDWNWYDNFPLARASYDGTTMRILNAYAHAEDTANLTRKWMRLNFPFHREEAPEGSGGLELSVSLRALAMTAGKIWHEYNNYSLGVLASGVAFDTHYKRAGGGFNSTIGATSYPNTQYDNGSGTLQDLGSSKYGTLWVYVDVSDGSLDVMYGAVNANSVAIAQADTAPTTPSHITYHGKLIGRIIFKKSDPSPTLVESAWTSTFNASAVGDHALLTNLQGGTASEYYHLTSAEYTGTGTGNFVRTTSPTLVTPVLGVATATSVMGLTTAQVTDLTDGGATTLHSHAGGGGNGAFQRVISADLTFAPGECLVLTGYLDLVTYSLTLDGDAQLEVL